MKVKYKAGDACGIPLRDGSLCLGVVSRRSGQSHVITCFVFCSKRARQVDHFNLHDLRAKDADVIFRCSGKYIEDGRWPLIGRVGQWRPQEWVVTEFRRDLRPVGINQVVRVSYDPDDILKVIKEVDDHDPSEPLPSASQHGSAVVEDMLSERVLGTGAVRDAAQPASRPTGTELLRRTPVRTFDNDDAADWLTALHKDDCDAIKNAIREAFDAVVELDAEEYLDTPEIWCAVAAVEVVAAGCDGNFARIPQPQRKWLRRCRDSLSDRADRTLALRALNRILVGPGVKELWYEASDYKAWEAGIRKLIKRLKG